MNKNGTSPALASLGVTNPVLAAPMAGGPSTVDLVVEAGRAGSLGFLAAGYKDVALLAEQVSTVHQAGVPFGVNVFAPNPAPISSRDFEAYARAIQPEADAYGIDLAGLEMIADDDHWDDKIALLLSDPPPVVSFTFGIPPRAVIEAFKRSGSVTAQTVTSPPEAKLAADAGVDLLVVQASGAGGHSGTFTPTMLPETIPLPQLVREIRSAVPIPLIAAGGIATADHVAAAIAAGAEAVSVGTALLLADESGTATAHRAALADPGFSSTVVTRAFTGRPARALRNAFTDAYSDIAPTGYPAIHHLTGALRQAAAAAHDTDRMHLWAGTGFAHATAEPAPQILERLASTL